jgi:hypothetical protein
MRCGASIASWMSACSEAKTMPAYVAAPAKKMARTVAWICATMSGSGYMGPFADSSTARVQTSSPRSPRREPSEEALDGTSNRRRISGRGRTDCPAWRSSIARLSRGHRDPRWSKRVDATR